VSLHEAVPDSNENTVNFVYIWQWAWLRERRGALVPRGFVGRQMLVCERNEGVFHRTVRH